MKFETEIVGDEELDDLLRKLANPQNLFPAMQAIALRLKALLKAYPPEPPDSTYRRTGTLGRKWTHRIQTSLFDIDAIIGNNTPYGPLVQDRDYQAEVHAGRWQTVQDVLENDAGPIVDEELGEAVDKLLGGG